MTQDTLTRQMTQQAPYPYELEDVVKGLDYLHWQVFLHDDMDRGQGSRGLTLVVTADVKDTYTGKDIRINHLFPVPPAAYDRRSWQWWVFGCLGRLDQHERMENFVVDGQRPYAPMHGPGNDPYLITVERTDTDRRTDFRGRVEQP